MSSAIRRNVLATTVLAALVACLSFAVITALADETEPAEVPAATEQELKDSEAFRRAGLTKILSGMEYTGASEERMAPIREELEQLGGPDPSVEPVDGPDSQAEWQLQAQADEAGCEAGQEDACERLPHSQQMAGLEMRTVKPQAVVLGIVIGLLLGSSAAWAAVITGTSGNDIGLVGTSNRDTISGLGGNDGLIGREGNDDLFGGGDDDSEQGSADADLVQGGQGQDVLSGEAGWDEVDGEDGIDNPQGANGQDTVKGGAGANDIVETEGDGEIDGYAGGDGLGDVCDIDVFDNPITGFNAGCEQFD